MPHQVQPGSTFVASPRHAEWAQRSNSALGSDLRDLALISGPRSPYPAYVDTRGGALSDCSVRNGYARGVGSVQDRGALNGAMVSGVFGVAWTEWGASGIAGAVSTTIRVAGIVVGLVIVFWSARLRRSVREYRSGSIFSSPSYRRIAIAEVVALFGGAALLGATGHHEFVIAWFATVVGVHFSVRPPLLCGVLLARDGLDRCRARRDSSGPDWRRFRSYRSDHWTDRCGKPVCSRGINRGESTSQQSRLITGQ